MTSTNTDTAVSATTDDSFSSFNEDGETPRLKEDAEKQSQFYTFASDSGAEGGGTTTAPGTNSTAPNISQMKVKRPNVFDTVTRDDGEEDDEVTSLKTYSHTDSHEERRSSVTDRTPSLSNDAADPSNELAALAKKAFASIADFIRADLSITSEDYSLLTEMNRISTQQYSGMRHVAAGIGKSLEDLNQKYRALQPYLDQIDQLEASVAHLEKAAYRLDSYSKKLETKFKQLEKK